MKEGGEERGGGVEGRGEEGDAHQSSVEGGTGGGVKRSNEAESVLSRLYKICTQRCLN